MASCMQDYEVNPRRLFDSRTARELLHAMPVIN